MESKPGIRSTSFLESFSVTREQAVAALELARTMTEAHQTAAR
jgi:hypothetical protein